MRPPDPLLPRPSPSVTSPTHFRDLSVTPVPASGYRVRMRHNASETPLPRSPRRQRLGALTLIAAVLLASCAPRLVAGASAPAAPERAAAPAATSPVDVTTLDPGESVRSRDGRFLLVHQTDGNVVLYGSTGALWQSATAGRPTSILTFQADGNLVLYAATASGEPGPPLWHTSTGAGPRQGDLLAVQDDSNLVIYAPDHARPVWARQGLEPPQSERNVRGSTADGCGGWLHTVRHHFGGETSTACRVLLCESGGNPAAHNGTSSASGLWQFLDGTWTRTTGRSPEARDYPPDVQTAAAKRLRDTAGWSQWACY